MKRTQTLGMTLIESLVVLAIIAIMTGIGTVGFIRYLPSYSLKSACRDLVSALQTAKIQAIKTNSNWAVVFDDPTACYVICSDPGADDDWKTLADNVAFRSFPLNSYSHGVDFGHGGATENVSGAAFGAIVPVGKTFVFDVRGRLASMSGSAYLDNDAGDTWAVTVRSTGSIAARHWEGSGWN